MTEDPSGPSFDPQDQLVADLLQGDRPALAPEFRGALAVELVKRDPGWGPRPERLWSRALALVGIGAGFLIVGALISVGGI